MEMGEEMPQELARELFESGATLLLKDFPEGLEFGVDFKSWNVGPKFLGLKMIPPGVHFVYMSVKNAPRIAFFHNFKPMEILYRKWDKSAEDLDDYVADETEIERIRFNLRNLDSQLGAYPYSTYKQWVSLSSYITPNTLDRLAPLERFGRITSQKELISKEQELERQIGDPRGLSVVDREHPTRIRFTDANGLPIMTARSETFIRFSEIPQISLADTNLKKAGIDSSDRLFTLFAKLDGNYKELLGEFQYAFIVFLMGQVYEGFEQWKRLVHLFCSCTNALRTHANLFQELLMVLHFQMKLVPDDFFHDVLANNNFLASTLSLLFMNIQDTDGVDSGFKTRSQKFKVLLEKRFNKSFTLPDE